MTSDDQQPELEETLRSRLAAAIPPAPSVAGWAERAAARARRRRARRRQALAVVGASCMASAIAIVAASYGGSGNGDTPALDTDREPAVVSTPQPPEGMRYVGINSVVVAVPNDWDLRIGGCYDSTEVNAVVVPSYIWPTCAGALPPVSLLRILSTDDVNAPGLLEDAQAAGEIGGIRVLRMPTEPAGDGRWESAVVVPAAKAIFWLEAPSTDPIERVFDTLTRLPDGHVALPSRQAPWPCVRDRLETAGTTVKIQEDAGSILPPGNIIDSKPTLGTVAKRGTTVTLTVPPGGPDKCLPPPTSPGQ